MKLQIIDADYTTSDGLEIRLFGKNSDGVYKLSDTEFRPYFYAVPEKEFEQLRDDVQDTEFETEDGEKLPILETEGVEKIDGREEIEALKIFTDIPANVPKLKNEVWSLDSAKECREFDIPFYRRYLIDKHIRPGSWVEIEGEEVESEDFKSEIKINDIRTVESGKEVEWNSLAFDLEVIDDRIVMASFFSENFRKVLSLRDAGKEYVEEVDDEAELLERFIEIVEENDTDILLGYNTDEFDFPVLREAANRAGLDLNLGRNGERMKFNRRGRFKGARIKARMHLDLYPFITHVMAPGIDSETLDLDSVAQEMLGERKDDLDWSEMKQIWREKGDTEKFAKYALKDAELTHQLGNQITPQILELSKITGLIPFDTCRLTYGQLTENYLLREAYERNMLAENRPSQKKRSKRNREEAYQGGFVYTPEEGLYENVAVFDFRSLYPTVMVAHNISPETLNVEGCEDSFELEDFDYSFCQDEQGFFPELVEGLVSSRYEIKEEMKDLDEDSSEYSSLYSRQQAQKILANSFYGYLGYGGARWYSRESAEATTFMGRKYIQETIEKAEEMGFGMVYGDSLDYSRQIILRDPDGKIRFMKIGKFCEKDIDHSKFETLAWDEEKQSTVFRKVTRAISHEYNNHLLRFDTNRGRTVVTPQHSVYAYNEEGIELVDAESLDEGDKLVSLSEPPANSNKYSEGDVIDLVDVLTEESELMAYIDNKRFSNETGRCPYCGENRYLSSHVYKEHSNRKVPLDQAEQKHQYIGGGSARTGRIPRKWELSTELAWILGFYCGDGSASTGKKKMISFGGQKKENLTRLKQFFDRKLDENLAVVEDIDSRTGNKMYYYRIQKVPIVEFFVSGLNMKAGSENKRVPNIIMNGDKELKKAFLNGYFEADGSLERDHDERYNSKSMRFSTKSSFLANQTQYLMKQMSLGENGCSRKINDVSYKYREDKPSIKSIRNTAPKNPSYAKLDFTPAKINNIVKEEPTKQKVYDLEVEGVHNFIDAEGLVLVHNTDSVMLRKDDLKQNMDQFLDEVNSELPKFMELEFEGLFKRGFFTSKESGEGAKKKYALIDDDGSMKITGFEQVRRDWSPIAKDTQEEVLRKVLEDDVEEAVDIVKDTIEALKSDDVDVEELKIYTTLTKPPEEYGSTAPHVEAVKKAQKRGDEIEPETTVDYVITRRGKSISEQAELTKYAENYDADYYVDNQIIPVALRVLKVFGYTEDQLKGKGRQSGLGQF